MLHFFIYLIYNLDCYFLFMMGSVFPKNPLFEIYGVRGSKDEVTKVDSLVCKGVNSAKCILLLSTYSRTSLKTWKLF